MKKYNDAEIAEIIKQNKRLELENRSLKKLVSSKRFKFAEKIATTYNVIFPAGTKRRKLPEMVAKKVNQASAKRQAKITERIRRELSKITEGSQKIMVINSILWDVKLKQRPHHLANQFANLGFFVIYLEEDNLMQKMRKIDKNLVTINDKKMLVDLGKNRKAWFLTANNLRTKLSDLLWIKEQGFEIIYDYLDEFHEDIAGELDIQLEVWENLRELNPTLVLATANKLYDEVAKQIGCKEKVILARNAVNVEHFDFTKQDRTEPPADLKRIAAKGHPIIGFYGALAPWIDYKLLNEMAKRRPEWEFVYIGIDYGEAMKDLKPGENVHNLGSKDYDQLADYTAWFDCAIIPFKQGEIAKATSPVKLFEYMAAGLPTVCTRDLDECRGYDYVYMSADANEFEQNLEKAIAAHKDRKVRMALLKQARGHTWEKRARAIAEKLLV